MRSVFEIPLIPGNQTFRISLGATTYGMRLVWRGEGWVLDVISADNSALVYGIPLVAGVDLFGQYRHLGFSGSLMIAGDLPPTINNLGADSKLYFVTDDNG